MIIELFGLPGSGKSTLARALESSGEASRIRIGTRGELVWRNVIFVARRPILSLRLLSYIVRYVGSLSLLYTKFMNLFLEHNAKYEKARLQRGDVVIDQGHFQNLLSLFERPMSEAALARYVRLLPKPDELWICRASEEERARRLAARGYGGGNEERAPTVLAENFRTAEKVIRSLPGVRVRTVEA
jgi:broad-specificity NMP kinase